MAEAKTYKLKADLEDKELVKEIKKAQTDALSLFQSVMKRGDNNYTFWQRGTDEDLSQINPNKSKVVNNRIFTDVETSIPILTANTPEPVILNVNNTLRENYAELLQMSYEVHLKLKQKLQRMARNWYSYYVGVIKYFWDVKLKRFDCEVINPKKIFFDRTATSPTNCEFVVEEIEEDVDILNEKYPKGKLKEHYPDLKGKEKYWEVWFEYGKWCAWIIPSKSIFLEKMENPNFDKNGNNLLSFNVPKFPFIFFNVFKNTDNNSLYDDTSLIEQCIPIQRDISRIERQISDLTDGQKRVWTYDTSKLKEEKAQHLVDETGDMAIGIDGSLDGLDMKLGRPDASMFNNLAHLLAEIDNIIGIHSTTRGERAQQETLGGRQLLQSADYGRQDLIVNNIEQVSEELYNAFFQLFLVYGTEPITFEDENRKITVDPLSIPRELLIMVKKGSTLPTDDKSRAENALTLAQFGMIDPKTLFEELGYGNEDERVKNLYTWLIASGKLSPEAIQMIQQEGSPQNVNMQRMNELLSNPQIKNLPLEDQQSILDQGREILSTIK
jgi:hypothetical protein